MAESYLSTVWYRVARLQPQRRAHLTVHRHRYRGRAWYVLYDHATGRVHRFTPAAWALIGRMDGRRTVDELWRSLAETFDAEAPSQDDVINLLSRLHQNDLLQYPGTPDVADLLERHGKQARQLMTQNLTNPVMFRLPLWDPDAFLARTLPWLRPLTGWFGLVLWGVVVLAGLVTAGIHWDALTHNMLDGLLSAQNILIMAIAYPLIKAAHELAHGYLAKARGVEVREMGLMFLVFFPIPYVDATAVGALPNKWHRAAVSAGGIFVETFIAAVAVMFWASAEPGLARAVAYNLVVIGGLSTLVVNGNPLLKFDGYYVLADLIECPNLATRANRYLGTLVQRHVFGARSIKKDTATRGERIWFLIYAPAAFVYRMVVMLGIALYVSGHAFVLGILIAAWTLFNSIVKPVFKMLRHVVSAPKLRKVRRRAVAITFGGIAVLLAALALVPLPLHTTTQGLVWLPDEAHLRARTSGYVSTVEVGRGAAVAERDVLIRLVEPALGASVAALEWRVEELHRRLLAEQVSDRAAAVMAELQLHDARMELDRERARTADLDLRAPLAGRFEPTLPPADMIGRYVAEGELLGHVLPAGPDHVRIAVRQDDIVLVRRGVRGVELALAGHLDARQPARLLREVPSALDALPGPALGQGGGGPFLVDPSDSQQMRVLEPVFVFDLALPEALADAPYGSRVHVRFDHGTEPAAQQIFRRLRQLFLRQFDA